jgi:hypothetical protein
LTKKVSENTRNGKSRTQKEIVRVGETNGNGK